MVEEIGVYCYESDASSSVISTWGLDATLWANVSVPLDSTWFQGFRGLSGPVVGSHGVIWLMWWVHTVWILLWGMKDEVWGPCLSYPDQRVFFEDRLPEALPARALA